MIFDLGVSGRKRVATASVIAMNTPVVVLDEPTGGQDAEGIDLLGHLVDHLVKQGKLVIVVTHDVKFAARHADRVIALHQGRVLLDDGPRKVFGQEEALARTHVEPPAATQLGKLLGLDETLLTPEELLAVLAPEWRRIDLGIEAPQAIAAPMASQRNTATTSAESAFS